MSTKNSVGQRIISCPNCKKETIYGSENEWRPFCSKRCRDIDLGAWAMESYRIESSEEDPTEDEHYQAPIP